MSLSVDEVWARLRGVPDPEIPAISLVDLGVIRDVAYEGGALVIGVAPTYTGCPATAAINQDIAAALNVPNLRLERRLSPPWTSDWISAEGHEKLRAYGIAPPRRDVACPQCGSADVARVSAFGSTPCKANYRCRACLEPFERFKCI